MAWIRRFALANGKRHPAEMGESEVTRFFSSLAADAGLPVVMTRDEVAAVLRRLEGVTRLMATLLYGSGPRFLEWVQVRVKDVDFASSKILVRAGHVLNRGWGAVRSPADRLPVLE